MLIRPFSSRFQRPSLAEVAAAARWAERRRGAHRRIGLRAAGPVAAMVFLFCLGGLAQTASDALPSINAGLGPCSVEFTVTNQKFQPLYNAQIRVHFKYGFWGIRRMDLQIGTNSAGQALVKGLPTRLRNSPLVFVVSYDGVSENWYYTGLDCVNQAQVVVNTR